MVWFGHDIVAYLIHIPACVAGMLLPYAVWAQGDVRWHIQGNPMGAALSAAVLARLGIGTAFLPSLWALLALPAAFLFQKVFNDGAAWHQSNGGRHALMSMPTVQA